MLLPFLLVGFSLIIYLMLFLKKKLKLYKYGQLSKGKIISMIPKSGISFFDLGLGVIIHYEYETDRGNNIIGKSFTTDFSILSNKKKDDYIPIFVSTENKRMSTIITELESKRNNWNINFE